MQQDDQELKCVDCGDIFLWTNGEQDFFARMHYLPPKRCKPCRQRRAERRGEDATAAINRRRDEG